MSELMTSLDVVNQAFKKTMRGYDPLEVDEFLDRVAECLQQYAQKTKDCEREIEGHLEKLSEYERMKDALQEALLMAQKTGEERIAKATGMADRIMSDARLKAEALIAEARAKADGIVRKGEDAAAAMAREVEHLGVMRSSGFAALRDFMQQMGSAIDGAEADGRLRLPEFPPNRATASYKSPTYERQESKNIAPELPKEEVPKKMGVADTLVALGLDPKLLEPGPNGF